MVNILPTIAWSCERVSDLNRTQLNIIKNSVIVMGMNESEAGNENLGAISLYAKMIVA